MTTDPDEIPFVTVTATCRTDGCPNEGIPLELIVPAEPSSPYIVCGVCRQQITDNTREAQPK